MVANVLLNVLGAREKLDLFTHDMEGREYLFVSLHRLLRRHGLGAEADALRRDIMRRLDEQVEKLAIRNEQFRILFARELLTFVLQALQHELLHPLEAQPHLNKVEETALALSADARSELREAVTSEYVGYAVATNDTHYLECTRAFLEKTPHRPEHGESLDGNLLYALAEGYAQVGRSTSVNYLPVLEGIAALLHDPYNAMRGKFLLHRTGQEFGPLLGHALSHGEILEILSAMGERSQRVLASAEAAHRSAQAGRRADVDVFLDESFARADRAFLLTRRGRFATRLMEILGEIVFLTREPRHLERMEAFLHRTKPRTETFEPLIHGAFFHFVRTLARLYEATGEEQHLDAARRYLGTTAPDEAVLELAWALYRRGCYADANRLLYRFEDEARSLQSFALEALSHLRQNDTPSFVQALERGLNQAEVAPLADGSGVEDAEIFLDLLRPDAVEIGRARLFRVMAALARRRYGGSDARYRIEIKCALGLWETGRRRAGQGAQSGASSEHHAEAEEILGAFPLVKRMQGLLAWARLQEEHSSSREPAAKDQGPGASTRKPVAGNP